MIPPEQQRPWQSALDHQLATIPLDQQRGIAILMPEYRPDICRAIAAHLALAFFDFRKEVMKPREMRAHEITVEEIDDNLVERTTDGGILAFNIESLLAVKTDEERSGWLARFSARKWPNPVFLPLTLFHDGLMEQTPRIDLSTIQFAPQSFLSRLAM